MLQWIMDYLFELSIDYYFSSQYSLWVFRLPFMKGVVLKWTDTKMQASFWILS